MKSSLFALLIIVTSIILLLGIYYFRNRADDSSSIGHANIQFGNRILEFDYPLYKDWNVSLDTNKIEYRPKSIFAVTRPPTIVSFRPILFEIAPDWSKDPMNRFGVRYKSSYSSVYFDDGRSGALRFEATINSVEGSLPTGAIIEMITATFHYN